MTVEGKITGEIGPGALILLGVEQGDTPAHAALMAKKIAELRVFCDDRDKMNRSLIDTNGEVLAVSNFTLCADWPSRSAARFFSAPPVLKRRNLYMRFLWRNCGVKAYPGWKPVGSVPICRCRWRATAR